MNAAATAHQHGDDHAAGNQGRQPQRLRRPRDGHMGVLGAFLSNVCHGVWGLWHHRSRTRGVKVAITTCVILATWRGEGQSTVAQVLRCLSHAMVDAMVSRTSQPSLVPHELQRARPPFTRRTDVWALGACQQNPGWRDSGSWMEMRDMRWDKGLGERRQRRPSQAAHLVVLGLVNVNAAKLLGGGGACAVAPLHTKHRPHGVDDDAAKTKESPSALAKQGEAACRVGPKLLSKTCCRQNRRCALSRLHGLSVSTVPRAWVALLLGAEWPSPSHGGRICSGTGKSQIHRLGPATTRGAGALPKNNGHGVGATVRARRWDVPCPSGWPSDGGVERLKL
ncbi:hypothetical protein BDW02DRAFT_433737 [Decorospora gaudefroyi]|uniref:Uncharacterized protein n=1 Tax=Decorospora gaudefroyi TaxID=184978 RepID=A0A6A5K6Z0_9PLEO|nr:hypothetical protein BDW02DRAFT_433737 [Decorospora gaudefroyi]